MQNDVHKSNGPYPGLRYYKDDQVGYFAGRDKEIEECTRRLSDARLLILHGRSGCGKSSFLRAGVKPMMERVVPGTKFDKGDAGLKVVRSSDNPLAALTKEIFNICREVIGESEDAFWRCRTNVSLKDKDVFKASFDGKFEEISNSGRKVYRLLSRLTNLLSVSPVLVVDQAEEIFTLREKLARDLVQKGDEFAEDGEVQLTKIDTQTKEFFKFLNRFAEDGARSARIIVSLRTEYKGQLDDKLAEYKADETLVEGFYLDDLSIEGLTEAIIRPTLDKDDWCKKIGITEGKVQKSPYEKYNFKFKEGVAEEIAKQLITSTEVAVGGILPTMQIFCLRLYSQAKQATNSKYIMINDLQRKRVGKIGLQIQDFLAEMLEDVCIEVDEKFKWEMGITEATERWHEILSALVAEQADGRAVSSTEPIDVFKSFAADAFASEKNTDLKVQKVVSRLAEDDIGLLLNLPEENAIALGHDSLALALNKWRLRHNQKDSMMKRMNMGSGKAPADFTSSDLFPVNYLPYAEDIQLHKDLHWDRQYPHFAGQKKFAERLGIKFNFPTEELDLTDLKSKNAPRSWDELTGRLRSIADKRRLEGKWTMVASDNHSFPWAYKEEDIIKDSDHKRRLISKWSDILVTDLFIGNGLIGLPFQREKKPDDITGFDAEVVGPHYQDVIKESFVQVSKTTGVIKCHDELARKFVIRAAELALHKNLAAYHYIRDYEENGSVILATEEELGSSGDGLVDWLLEDTDDERSRFIVGTASARALALQAGAELYFATSHLTLFTRYKINRYVLGHDGANTDLEDDKVRQRQSKLNEQIQEVIKHTNWQIDIPPAQWKRGRNRALILRLASIGYFTSEYVRSNGDEFVRYIRAELTARYADAIGDDQNSLRGLRINREAIRSAVKDCYSIMRFDDVGTEFFDLDSTTAYSTISHSALGSKSIASEIYSELALLRQRTISNYETLSRIIEWMTAEDKYDPKDSEIKKIIELKRCAWNNFRIFNFYDSARLMADAALGLQRKMESV